MAHPLHAAYKTVPGFVDAPDAAKNHFDNPFIRALMTHYLHLNRYADVMTLIEQSAYSHTHTIIHNHTRTGHT